MRLRSSVPALLAALVASASIGAVPAQASPVPAAGSHVPGEVLVKWAPGASANARAAERARHGLRTAGRVGDSGFELLTMDPGKDASAVAGDLRRRGAAAAAQPNFLLERQANPVNDTYWSNLWGLSQTSDIDLDVPEAWATQRGSSSVVVAVIDTGVQIGHPDLVGNIWTNPGEVANGLDDDSNGKVDDVNGWDFVDGTPSVYDSTADTHGTHVAGTIAATADNGIGVAGVAPGVRIMPLKFLGADGTGSTSKAIEAIAYAKAKGARVINASWGSPGSSNTALRDAIANSGAVFVAAAGNGGDDQLGDDNDVTPYLPASLDAANIVSVAAVTSSGARAPYSNYGDTSVDVGAPGSSILSTVPGGYGTMSGTSMAAPHVAGVAALLASAAPSMTANEIVALLKSSSVSSPLASLAGMTVTGGMPNARTAIDGIATPVWPHGATVTVADVSDTSFGLTWPAATDNVSVADYQVTVGARAPVTTTSTSLTVTGLAEATTYPISIRARDGNGNLSPALTTSVTTRAVTPTWPQAAALTVAGVTTSGFELSWPAANDDLEVTGYGVKIGSAAEVVVAGTVREHAAAGLPEATDHAVELTAIDADGRRSAPLRTTVRTLSTAPAWPNGAVISATAVTTSGFTLSWTAATDDVAIVSYDVTVGSRPAAPVAGTTLVVEGLTAGTAYPVSVVARDGEGKVSSALTKNVSTAAPVTSGGGGGGGGGFAPAPTAPTAPTTTEPVTEEPTATTDGSAPSSYDGTTARTLELACPTAPPSSWTDVPASSPHAAGIGCATAWEVFLGGAGATFSPAAELSRGQLASVLARAIEQSTGAGLPAGGDTFADDDGSVHEDAINALAAVGIVGGIDDDSYAPTAPVTRAQFAAMLARTYRHLTGELPTGADVFVDDDGNTHEESIQALAALGIVTGDGRGSYAPGEVLTRAQSASMVARLIDALVEVGAAG